jgi:hypothetical protein
MSYASLADVIRELKTQRATQGADAYSATDVAWLSRFLDQITHRINIKMAPRTRRQYFEPWKKSETFPMYSRYVNLSEGSLELPHPLLALSSLKINNTEVSSSLYGVQPYASTAYETPHQYLWLTESAMYSYTWYTVVCANCPTSRTPQVTVADTWGYHRDYTSAWQKAGELQAGIAASATSLTVADVDGADYYGFSPRFSYGQLIQLTTGGTAEWMRITATDTATNTLTVLREQNGTTAIAHTTDTPDINVFYPEESINRVTTRQAAFLYARRGAFEASQSDGMGGQTTYPQDLLNELNGVLQEYVNAW